MGHTLLSSILAIILVQGALQAIALFTAKRNDRRANRTMGFFIIACMIMAFDSFLHYTGYIKELPFLIRVFTPLYGLSGVILFCYSKCLTHKDFKYSHKSFIYFIPTVLAYLAYSPIYFYPNHQKIAYALGHQGLIWRTLITVFISAFNVFFLVNGFLRLRRYHRAIRNHYSNLSALQLTWLERIFIVGLFLTTISFTITIITSSQGFQLTYLAIFISSFLMILFTSYSALKQIAPLFTLLDDIKHDMMNYKSSKHASSKKEITSKQSQEIKESLNKLMDEQIYLEPDLKLSTLSQKANFPSYLISQVLNHDYKMNFFEFINSHRIEEAKKRLLSDEFQELTILAIAEDVGFSSKSSFNATFKKMVGKTPSQFRNTLKSN